MKYEIEINGAKAGIRDGDTILTAARRAGVRIPALCHDSRLKPSGVCRVCVVEVEGAKSLVASCAMPAVAGMRIKTDSARVAEARKTVLELMLSELSPGEAAKYKGTDFGQLLKEYGIRKQAFPQKRRRKNSDKRGPLITQSYESCILCRKCFMTCSTRVMRSVTGLVGKGAATTISTPGGAPLLETECEFCGNCVQVCPTGALIEDWKRKSGPGTRRAKTICTYCGTGCGIVAHVKGGKVIGVEGDVDNPVSHGDLCVKGRFAFDFVHHRDRLRYPMIRRRKGGRLVRATWAEALDFIAAKVRDIKDAHGPDAIAGVSSSRCSNEENYVMSKLMRAAIGTNNIDNCARVCHAPSVTGLAASFGSGAATNSLEEIEGAEVIFVIGSNPAEAHPVIALKIKRAVSRGAKLIVADPRMTELAEMADVHLGLRAGTNVALVNGMLNVVIEENLTDDEFIARRTQNYDAVKKMAMRYPPEAVSRLTGVAAEDIRRAARTYAASRKAMILYGLGITEHVSGTNNVKALANLVMATGSVGRPSAGVNPLRGQNNVQGACDMGALPNVFPGYQPVADEAVRAKFEKKYGLPLPGEVGLKTTEYYDAIENGELKALLIMAMDPAATDPNLNRVRECLKKLDLLVVFEIFPTETAKFADVILPGASFAEKDGTFTNAERRVQLFRKVINPLPGVKPDWKIVKELSRRLGYKMDYKSPEDIWNEIAALAPDFAGITYQRLENEGGLCWPCPDKAHPGTPVMYEVSFPTGLGRFNDIPDISPKETPDREYPLTLITGRRREHYNDGSMTRRSPALMDICPREELEINPADARRSRVKTGDRVRVSSRRGEVVVHAKVTRRSPPGSVFLSFHFDDVLTNDLTSEGVDFLAGTPEYKVSAVRIVKVKR